MEKQKPGLCPICDRDCRTKLCLSTHMKKMHPENPAVVEKKEKVEEKKVVTSVIPEILPVAAEIVEKVEEQGEEEEEDLHLAKAAKIAPKVEKTQEVVEQNQASTSPPQFDPGVIDFLVRETDFAKSVSSELTGMREILQGVASSLAHLEKGNSKGVIEETAEQNQPTTEQAETAPITAQQIQNALQARAQQAGAQQSDQAAAGPPWLQGLQACLQMAKIAGPPAAEANPMKQFMDSIGAALELVSTMRKLTIEEMKTSMTTLSDFSRMLLKGQIEPKGEVEEEPKKAVAMHVRS